MMRLTLWPSGVPAALSRVVGRIAPRQLLVAHGTDNWLVRPSRAGRLHAAAGAPKELALIQHGLHADTMLADAPEPLLATLLAFFDRWP
jgi:hypothetical protein